MQSSNDKTVEFARIRTIFSLVNLTIGLAAIAVILVLAVLI
jgi:hypothetical protein